MITADDALKFLGKNVTVTKTDKTTVSGQAVRLATSGMLSVIDSIVIDPGAGGPLLTPSIPVTIPFAEIESVSLTGGMNIAGMNIGWDTVIPVAVAGALAFVAGSWYERNYGSKAPRRKHPKRTP